jgi:biopolymer transport protein ExbD
VRRAAAFVIGLMFALCGAGPTGAAPAARHPDRQSITLEVRQNNDVLWNGRKVSFAELDRLFAGVAKTEPPPEIHLVPNKLTDYATMVRVLTAAQRAGATNLGFTGIESDH